ncbi:MAG: 50S ribosomal protein L22 [Candidatus Diapherotrites archaeon]|nr:50S ribosomal protein L22 [Candidatus Diapherotrites archaeon]
MAKKNYQASFDPKKTCRVIGKNKPVSLKYSTELVREIKGKMVSSAEAFLNRVLEKKDFLPIRRYTSKIGHRKGEAKSFTKTGKYPFKVAKVFLGLLSDLRANADYKGMNAEKLLIVHGFASMGYRRTSNQPQGRISGKARKNKSTHIELIALEAA